MESLRQSKGDVMSNNGQSRPEQLPYYQEYVEQILKPRVMRLLEDVRGRLAEHAWQDLLIHMAHDQGDSQPTAESLAKLRTTLETSLVLQVNVQLSVECGASEAEQPSARRVEPTEARQNVDVVDRSFPDNPLARAVGSVRRVGR
jgi:hypothetical protein